VEWSAGRVWEEPSCESDQVPSECKPPPLLREFLECGIFVTSKLDFLSKVFHDDGSFFLLFSCFFSLFSFFSNRLASPRIHCLIPA